MSDGGWLEKIGVYSMMVHIRAFGAFREILGKERDVEVKEGSTISDLLSTLISSNERLRSALLDEAGNIRDYVTLTKNKKSIDFFEGLRTELEEKDEVAILPPIAGG
jgi:MoaD family protein